MLCDTVSDIACFMRIYIIPVYIVIKYNFDSSPFSCHNAIVLSVSVKGTRPNAVCYGIHTEVKLSFTYLLTKLSVLLSFRTAHTVLGVNLLTL